MTLDEFKAALTEAGHQWDVDYLTVSESRFRVRDERGLCPICSLATDRGWVPPVAAYYGKITASRINSEWDHAGGFLGLEVWDATTVVEVADGGPDRLRSRVHRQVNEWLLTLVGKEKRHDA